MSADDLSPELEEKATEMANELIEKAEVLTRDDSPAVTADLLRAVSAELDERADQLDEEAEDYDEG